MKRHSSNTVRLVPVALTLIIVTFLKVTMIAQVDSRSLSDRLAVVEDALRSTQQQLIEMNLLLRSLLPRTPVEEFKAELDVRNSPKRGLDGARFALIEFSDFQCPFCGQHFSGAYQELQREYVDTGDVAYYFKHLPVAEMHPDAIAAATAAACAQQSGRFWEMHDRLFSHQQALGPDDLVQLAIDAGVPRLTFEACLRTGAGMTRVKSDLADARELGLAGTPVFLVGSISEPGHVTVSRIVTGAQPITVFREALSSLRAKTR